MNFELWCMHRFVRLLTLFHSMRFARPFMQTVSRGQRAAVALTPDRVVSRSIAATTFQYKNFVTSTRPLQMSAVSGSEILKTLFQGGTTAAPHGQNVELAMESLANADCVCFDVDSTVIAEEGIDVLADFLGKGEEVAALTLQAMEGGMKFQDALAARLQLLRPSRPSIETCLRQRPFQLTPGVKEFITKLQDSGKQVYLVSGGFRIMIEPIAAQLNIPKSQIVANTILFDGSGNYHSFDSNEPTSQDMGKPRALEMIQAAGNFKTMIMIGDGATDAQAKPPATAFIGFGGIAVREKVKNISDWFVVDFQDLITIVDHYGKN